MSDGGNRVLIARLGAIGDTIITTPLVSWLHSLNYEIVYLTSELGYALLQNNPKIFKAIKHAKDSVHSSKLGEYFKAVAQAEDCDHVIDLCESIEVNLALHPSDPRYKYPKYERKTMCDRNYYEETLEIAQRQMGLGHEIPWRMRAPLNPEHFPTEDEDRAMRAQFARFGGAFTVLIGLSGSARQKVFPFYRELIDRLTAEIPSVQFVTVGDEACQILEYNLASLENVLCTSGVWSIRESVLATKYASLVVAPDTGLLHGSGCYDTPKIGLMTSTSITNITKHFQNDMSMESEGVGCAPCFYLIHDADTQCNLGDNRACLCMSRGHSVDRIAERALEALYKFGPKRILEVTANA